MGHRDNFRVVERDPRRVFDRHIAHLIEQGQTFWGVIHVADFLKELVVLRVLVPGVIRLSGAGVEAVEQEDKVFRIRIVGKPSVQDALMFPFDQLVTEDAARCGADFDFDTGALDLAFEDAVLRACGGGDRGAVNVNNEALARFWVFAAGVAGFGDQLFGAFDVDDTVGMLEVFIVAKEASRKHPLRGCPIALEREVDEFL